jgi:type I restriction enzyme S subunit
MGDEREFKNLPEGWKWVRLGEVIEEVNDRKGKITISTVLTVSNTEGLIDQTEFFGRNLSSKDTSNYKIVCKWFFVYNPARINVGSIALNKSYDYAIVSPMYSVFKTKENLLPNYFAYWIQLPAFKYMVINNTAGSVRESLNFSRLITFDFPLPPLPEQQKIAEILETVDNAIEKTDKIIEKYKRIKQGLMQDLLTKGIDENGNIRSEKTHKFKDSPLGKIPEEWEVVRLGEVFKLKSGKTKPIDTSEFGNYPVYGGNGILGYTNEKNFNKETIIIGRVGEYCGSVYIANEGWVTDNALYVVAKKIDYNNIFLCYLLKYLNLNQFSAETGQPLMTQTIIYSLPIPLPPLPEQQRIAEVLSQIDQTIEKEQQYKEKLQRIKQGLMQDLLTGKVRVNHLVEEKENEQRYTSNFTRT